MGEWEKVEIKEIILKANTGLDAIRRAPIVDENTGIKCLRIQDVSQRKEFDNWGFTQVEKNDYDKFQLKKDDIIIARTGASIGVNLFISKNLNSVFNNGLIRLRVNKERCKPLFIYYNFRTKYYNDFIESISGGTSTQPNMQINALLSFSIVLPGLDEQDIICNLLKSLDDKIDLLHRQNKSLEQLAETLFRQWFVEEADESWEVGTIEDEFDFTMGQSPEGTFLNENKEGMIFYQGRTDFDFRFPNPRIYTTSATRIAKKFDTLVSVRAPVGDMNMAIEECCLGRGVAAFRFKHNSAFYSYTYYKMRSLMAQIKQFEDSGTVFGSIGKDDFKKLENIVPSSKLIEEFQNSIKPVDDKIFSNTNQIRTLTQLRDTLLPKLMSGEVRVKV